MKIWDAEAVKAAYATGFKDRLSKPDWKTWRDNYLAQVQRVEGATDAEWMTPAFQELLWDKNPISTLGPGVSVQVAGAYSDRALAQSLRAAYKQPRNDNVHERGAFLQAVYEDTLKALQPYNERQPKARLTRLLAALFPQDVGCILNWERLRQIIHAMGIRTIKGGFIANHTLLLNHLRNVLGDPPSLADQVEQSIFSWYFWERVDSEAPGEEGAVLAGPRPEVVTNIPRLHLLPPAVQRKGLTYVSNNVALLVSVVRECEQGITRSDLVGVIQREAPQLKSANSATNIISQAQGGLSLITLQDGAYRPTERGSELITAPEPEQVLQPLLVARVFGMGHLLLALKDTPDGIGKSQLSKDLSKLIPTRTTQWSGGGMISWALVSKLAKRNGDAIALTEDGLAYAQALPSDFLDKWKIAPPEDDEADDFDGRSDPLPSASDALAPASWDLLNARFADGMLSSTLILPDGFLAELHAALHASPRKRFVLLAGLSGTGKTSIARAYAEAYSRALGFDDWRARYAQIAVRPDWTDPSGLVGFVNAVSEPPTFQAAEALHLILRADADRTTPYFLCLDEMNLARVEHYFAPFLSAMEGDASELALHGEAEAIDNVKPRIPWPRNLFIFGTVNMDESTHPFSDKILDRAFTFEFWDVDLESWERSKRAAGVDSGLIGQVAPLLRELYRCLYPSRRHFGYRTADESLAYCVAGAATTPVKSLLDSAVLMKVLPRVRGDDSGPLADTLKELHRLLTEADLPRSLAKVEQMQSSLERVGQARFWS